MLWFTKQKRRRQETHYYAFKVGILATSARFKADFGLFSRFNLFRTPADMTQYGRYGPILTESAQFGPNQSRVSANQAKSARIWGKKKKKAQMRLISPFTDFSIYQVVFLNSMITKSRVPELETTADDPLNKDHYV